MLLIIADGVQCYDLTQLTNQQIMGDNFLLLVIHWVAVKY